MRIKRRQFLMLGSFVGLSSYIQGDEPRRFEKKFQEVKPLIVAVQQHLFPSGSQLPSAEAMQLTEFLFDTLAHQSFDKDIREFVLDGAKELGSRTKNKFLTMSPKEREKALREYEKTEYGSSWLSRMMTLSMEGMLSDPVYGSNKKEAGWKALDAYGGQPRPKTRYLNDV